MTSHSACKYCGGTRYAWGYCTTDGCDSYYAHTRHIEQWPLHLGLAIARFCRNARVAELVEAVRRTSKAAEDLCTYGESIGGPPFDEEYATLDTERTAALDELARLARDGGGR